MEINIPVWVQQVTVFGVMISSVILGIWKYFKTQTDKVHEKEVSGTSVVAAASFVDAKLLRELIDTLREHQEELGRQSQRITRSQGELRETLIEAIEALHVQTNATLNMLRFMNRQAAINN